MSKTVTIEQYGLKGEIEYQDDPYQSPIGFEVRYPISRIRKRVIAYLTTPRDFMVPESEKIDDYRKDHCKPTKNVLYFEQSLNQLHRATSVFYYEQ